MYSISDSQNEIFTQCSQDRTNCEDYLKAQLSKIPIAVWLPMMMKATLVTQSC